MGGQRFYSRKVWCSDNLFIRLSVLIMKGNFFLLDFTNVTYALITNTCNRYILDIYNYVW